METIENYTKLPMEVLYDTLQIKPTINNEAQSTSKTAESVKNYFKV